jgi:DNA-binding NarL/FixJ family response regulator
MRHKDPNLDVPRDLVAQPLAAAGSYRQGVVLMQGAVLMEEQFGHVGPRDRQIIDLLLQGCDNSEIAKDLNIAERTVKAHFNRLFLRFGIKGGIKRVKLATLLYRRQLWLEKQQTAAGPANVNSSSFNA